MLHGLYWKQDYFIQRFQVGEPRNFALELNVITLISLGESKYFSLMYTIYDESNGNSLVVHNLWEAGKDREES